VDMHLPKAAAIGLGLDIGRTENAGNAGRSHKHIPEELPRIRMAAGSDRTHVPDHAPLCVEIGRYDEKAAAASLLLSDGCDELWRKELIDEVHERIPAEIGRAQKGKHAAEIAQNLGDAAAEGFRDLHIVVGTQESERRDQCARADASDDSEFGPVAC